jgi:glycosyltransferase involved in cell wall biosynthesis
MSKKTIWIWQEMISPHMLPLAIALVDLDFEVIFVVRIAMSSARLQQGWEVPDCGNVSLVVADSKNKVTALLKTADPKSIHICQGIRSNGLIGYAQKILANRGMVQWVAMETVDEVGFTASLKRLIYRIILLFRKDFFIGFLAIGTKTSNWIVQRGALPNNVFTFAYFLKDSKIDLISHLSEKNRPFRFTFIGRLVNLKRLDLLITALGDLAELDFELVVIGSGAEQAVLQKMSNKLIPGKVHWKGNVPINSIANELINADCLVLPSRYDGWGAVITESLMVGTPVICSDGCGAAEVVKISNFGGVFKSGSINDLKKLLISSYKKGPLILSDRAKLGSWARCLGAAEGARYLDEIIKYSEEGGRRPRPPWLRG